MKVLVDLNGCENYSIRIDRTDSAVVLPFNQVYNEIRKQIKHNITSNTHIFEIFDKDFCEYCVITSDNYVIEDLSRLRVRPKTVNNESIGLGINRDLNIGHKYSHKIQYEKNELNLSENNINKCEDSITDYENREETDGSIAGDSCSQSVYTNSEINSDTLWAPKPQSPTPPLPSKLPQKLARNVIKKFNAENGIKVVDSDDSTGLIIKFPAVTTPAIDLTSHRVRYCFDNIITNAGYFVQQPTQLPTTGTPSVGNEGQNVTHFSSFIQTSKPLSTPIPSPLAPGSHPSAPINYLDVEFNSDTFATTASSPHMAYITFTACVGTVWVTGMLFMLAEYRAIIRLMHILKTNICGNDSDVIVKHMSKSGFNDWNYEKCLNYFYNALKLYKKTLANCPNRETAATVYPLFNTMHSFVPYFLMTAKDFTKLNELKRLFDEKCGECHTIFNPNCSTAPIATNWTDNGSDCNHTLNLPLNNSVDPTRGKEQNPIDYLGLPLTGKQFTVNTSSPHLPYVTVIIKVKGVWFRTGHFGAANHLALNLLLQLVDKHRPTDGRPMTDTEWARVANNMPSIKDPNKPDVVFDPKLCQNYLQNALDLYKKILHECPNMDRAGIAFPMFHTFHIFNTASVVSDAECREIQRLRELFSKKCKTDPYIVEVNVSALPVPSQTPNDSGLWPKSCPNTCEVDAFRKACANITRDDFDAFTHLCLCVDEAVKTLGPFEENRELFWSHVWQLMLESGYGSLDKSTCRLMFTQHVGQYYKT
ncbi:unnamed protein product, partial [Medioppia subpectinata]